MKTQPQMQPPSNLVLGLGKTGYSVVRYLCGRGERVTAADSREAAPYLDLMRQNYPRVKVITGRLPRELFGEVDRIVVSPGLAVKPPPPPPMIGDIELFASQARAPIIAITGSNGKSTVTHLLGEMLAAAGKRVLIGGNIGTPALDLLDAPSPDFYALELSSFQLETTHSLRTAAAAILNISEDHMDRYADMQDYAAAKARILSGGGTAVLNRDDVNSRALLRAHPAAITFGLDAPAAGNYGVIETAAGKMLARGDAPLADLADINLPGEAHLANILAAVAVVEAAGVAATPAVMAAALDFRGLSHRMELVGEFGGVRWVNDSKATNVGAAIAALQSFGCDKNLILIAGGRGKGANFSALKPPVQKYAAAVVVFGEAAAAVADAVGTAAEIVRAGELADAVTIANDIANRGAAGQTVLFSPACASFDMFADFAARGDAFKRAVAATAGKLGGQK